MEFRLGFLPEAIFVRHGPHHKDICFLQPRPTPDPAAAHIPQRYPDFRPALVLDRSVDTGLDGISLDQMSGRPMIAAHASPSIRILNPSQPLGKDDLRQRKIDLATQ